MITHDQLLLEGIMIWSKDLQEKILEFAPRLKTNFRILQTEIKERLNKGLFGTVHPLYRHVVECTRLRWVYVDCDVLMFFNENSFQVQCVERLSDWPRIIKTFTVEEVLSFQSLNSRSKLVTSIVQVEYELFEIHKEKLRKERRETIIRLRDELERLESEII